MTLVVHKNGNGTIQFGQMQYYYTGGERHSTNPNALFKLENIPNAVQVHEIISNATTQFSI